METTRNDIYRLYEFYNSFQEQECEVDEKNKYKIIICLVIIILSAVIICKFVGTRKTAKYTYEQLNALSAKELYEVFIDNGLKVDEELKTYLTDEQIASVLKGQFDMMIHGTTSRSHYMYKRFAEEVERVYKLLVGEQQVKLKFI